MILLRWLVVLPVLVLATPFLLGAFGFYRVTSPPVEWKR